MFFESEAVRSRLHGLGRVVGCGSDPIVQFVDGPRCRVHRDARTLGVKSLPAYLTKQQASEMIDEAQLKAAA